MSELSKRLRWWAKDDIVPGDLKPDLLAAAEIVEGAEWRPISDASGVEPVFAGKWADGRWVQKYVFYPRLAISCGFTHYLPIPAPPEVKP